jgi:hypothetical protein
MNRNAGLREGEARPGYVYLIHAVGTKKFKIGKSRANVLRRIDQLQSGSPIRLRYVYHACVDDMNRIERELHLLFDRFRSIGEWFTLSHARVTE